MEPLKPPQLESSRHSSYDVWDYQPLWGVDVLPDLCGRTAADFRSERNLWIGETNISISVFDGCVFV